MNTWNSHDADTHRLRMLLSALIITGLVMAGQVAQAQSEDEAAEPNDSAAEEPVTKSDSSESDVPSSYADWFQQMMDKSHKPFEYHGYIRSGFGFNGKLGAQEAFKAPNVPKYRLGNETETYGELQFNHNWLNPEKNGDQAWFMTQVRLAFQTANLQSYENPLFFVPEAFVQAGNVLKSQPGLKFWAGQRFYRRHDFHLNDYFFYSESGYGGGIEDLNFGSGKLALAYLGDATEVDTSPDVGRLVEHNLEARVYDINVPGGTALAAVKLSYSRGEPTFDNVTGVAVRLQHVASGFMGGFNKFTAEFGYGGSSDLDAPLVYRTPNQALQDSYQIQVADAAQIDLSNKISAMGQAIVRYRDNGDTTDFLWISAGIRPIYHFTKYTGIATEAALDITQGSGPALENYDGYLFKFTVAPQVRAGQIFWARPSIRAFATAAKWSTNYRDEPTVDAGGAAYAADTFGLSFGLQAESWW